MLTGSDLYGDAPLFPTFYSRPSAELIERACERLVDRADAQFLAGKMTQAHYDAWYRQLQIWADRQYLWRPGH